MKQRWERSFTVQAGHWKTQLPTKVLGLVSKLPVLQATLKEHPEFLNKRANHGRTLLWEATRAGKIDAVRWLARKGADVNTPGCYNSESYVPISPYVAAKYYRRDPIADFLSRSGSTLDIFRSAFLGEMNTRLTSRRINAEDPFDEVYYTPLITFAVSGGHADLTSTLIDRGAEVAPYSAQLLFAAGRLGRKDLLELLLKSGADPRAADARVLVATDDMECFRFLLKSGVPADGPGYGGFTPLTYVARGDKGERPDKISALLDHGADPNVPGPRGRTPLDYATQAGFKKVEALLLERGAAARGTRSTRET